MIKVVMERQCIPGNERLLESLLIDLRSLGMRQPGYISGETLIRIDKPCCYLTIGTWSHFESWKDWEKSPEREKLTAKINNLLVEEPRTQVYATLSPAMLYYSRE